MTRPYLHRLARDGVFVLAFNVLCAVVVTWLLGIGHSFAENLLFSMCIGTIAFLLIDGARLLLWGPDGKPNWPVFSAIIVAAVFAANWLGTALGAWLIGYPLPSMPTSLPQAGSIIFTLLATGGATLFFTSRDRLMRAQAAAANERARAEAVERRALQAQLQLLQAQLEPHMLFNTLANLQGLIAIDPVRAQHMLDQLIQFLRATLTASRSESATLAQEFALTDAYLGLMSVRMGERLKYTLALPSELAGAAVPPMLLQPLVENAIAHGLEPKLEGGHIAVSARRDGASLVLAVADDGLGPDAQAGKPGTSVGLSNTRERLAALFGERASLTLAAAPGGGAIATITLPA